MGQKAFVKWERAIEKIPLPDLVKVRIKLGIPEYGFKSVEECNKWVKASDEELAQALEPSESKNGKEKLSPKFYELWVFQKQIATQYQEIRHGFESPITDLILYGEADKKQLLAIDDTGCSWVVADKEKEIGGGIYMKIGPDTVLDDIENFIRGNSKTLKQFQREIYGKLPARYKPTKQSKTYYRDLMIREYGKYSVKQIREILTRYPDKNIDLKIKVPKDILIVKILKSAGFKYVTPEIVRKILSQTRKK